MAERDKRILLIGGGGFMGRAFAQRLHALGYEVHVVVRGTTVALPEHVTVHGGGMENTEMLQQIVPSCGTVVHMASGTTPSLSNRTPSLEAKNNLGPTLDLIDVLMRAPPTRLVYVSSGGTVYGNPASSPVPETAATDPLSFYGCGKTAIEVFLKCFARMSGNPLLILRPSNLYGPGQPRYQGFAVVRTLLQHLYEGSTMQIWGDGSVVRDFLYIDDMVDALELALHDATLAGTFNIGSGAGCSLNELVEIAQRISARRLDVTYHASRAIDVKRIVLDIAAAERQFGWKPRVALETGIARTWEWLLTQTN